MFGKTKKPSSDELMADLLAQAQAKTEPSNESSELELKFAALWNLLQEKFALSDKELESHIERIKAKEKEPIKEEISEPNLGVQKCPKCDRTVSAKTGICIYCGKEE